MKSFTVDGKPLCQVLVGISVLLELSHIRTRPGRYMYRPPAGAHQSINIQVPLHCGKKGSVDVV